VPQGASESVLDGLASFVEFLATEGLLDPQSLPPDVLEEGIEELALPFFRAMGDPANFGMAKSLFAGVDPDLDLSDPAVVQRHMDEFNALPEEERRRRLPDRVLGLGGANPLPLSGQRIPAVALPDDAAYAASAAKAPILKSFTRLVDFVGDGRKLTQRGQITLADARVLVELLKTGDVMDPVFGDRTFKTVSSADLPGLRQVFTWARKAGVVRVAKGRVMATKKAAQLDPVTAFENAVKSLVAIGPLASQRDENGWLAWPEVVDVLDEAVPLLLIEPYVLQEPVPLAALADIATDAVLDAFEFRSAADDEVERRVGYDVADIARALVAAGVLTVHPTDVDGELLVELTPAGQRAVRQMATDLGIEAPVAGRLAAGTAAELLAEADHLDLDELAAELDAWRRRRTPAEAAAGLADAARILDDFGLQNIALAVLTQVGVEAAEPFVRNLTGAPSAAGLARCWLVDHGCDDPSTLFDPDELGSFAQVLAHRMVLGPDDLAAALALAGDHQAQLALLDRLWKVPNPLAAGVLDGIGATHPMKATAKAARKAALRHRSWLANR
ncbi:MAG: hypothetical protein WKF86_11660, partial [Acidimicrobiales bacterium]